MKSRQHPHLSLYNNSLFTLLLICTIGPFASAQSYSTTAGVRFGNQIGLTVNQLIGDKLTAEAIIESNLQEAGRAHLLVRKHSSILWRRINVYGGVGPHVGWGQKNANAPEDELGETVWGATGVLGFEFTLLQLNVSFDYLPVYQQGQENVKGYKHNGALSVRYVIEKANNKKRRQKQKAKRKRQRHKRKAQDGRNKFPF